MEPLDLLQESRLSGAEEIGLRHSPAHWRNRGRAHRESAKTRRSLVWKSRGHKSGMLAGAEELSATLSAVMRQEENLDGHQLIFRDWECERRPQIWLG